MALEIFMEMIGHILGVVILFMVVRILVEGMVVVVKATYFTQLIKFVVDNDSFL